MVSVNVGDVSKKHWTIYVKDRAVHHRPLEQMRLMMLLNLRDSFTPKKRANRDGPRLVLPENDLLIVGACRPSSLAVRHVAYRGFMGLHVLRLTRALAMSITLVFLDVQNIAFI